MEMHCEKSEHNLNRRVICSRIKKFWGNAVNELSWTSRKFLTVVFDRLSEM